MNKYFIPLILLICILYTGPFFHSGFFPTQDGGWAVVRLAEMVRELKDLQIPPRFSDFLNHGYGYPLFEYTYPLPFYLGSVLKIFGAGLINAIKILFVSSVILSGLTMYFLGKKMINAFSGFISAVFYIIAPYRLTNLYVRGSLGESLSLILYPLIFLVTMDNFEKPKFWKSISTSVFLALLILTHNISALLFFPLWIGFILFNLFKKKPYKYNILIKSYIPQLVLCFALSMYFFIPALFEKSFIILSQIRLADPRSYFVHIEDLLLPVTYIKFQPVFYLGIFQLVAVCVSFASVLFIKKNKKYKSIVLFLFLCTFLYAFFTNTLSFPFWNLPPLSLIDFPFRFLNILIFILSFSTVFLGLNKIGKYVGILLVCIGVFLNYQFVNVREYKNPTDAYYSTNDATTTSLDELMPVWVSVKPKNRYNQKVEIESGRAKLNNITHNSKNISFSIAADTQSVIRVNTIYFPGWKFWINGKEILIDYSNPQGIMTFQVNQGNFTIVGNVTETPIRLLSNYISLASWILVGILLIKYRKK
jgi:hypothetical protein